MKNPIKTIVTTLSILMLSSVVFADEIPGQKDFAEVTREITKESAQINAEVTNFNKSQSSDAQTSTNKLKELEKLIDNRIQVQKNYNEKPTEANLDIWQAAEKAEELAKNAIINDMTESVNRQTKFVEDISVKYYKLGNLLKKFGKMTENYGKNQIDASALSAELEKSIVNSANVVQGLLESMPEESEDLNAILDSLENEASMLGGIEQELSVSEQIKRRSEMLKDYSAQLIKIKGHLEIQKKNIALMAIINYIKNTENRLATYTSGVMEANFIKQVFGPVAEGNKNIKSFQSLLNKDKPIKNNVSNDKRRTNLNSLRNKYKK